MINFGLSLREELKHEGIKVGVFAPGGIKTEMTDIPAMKALEKDLAPVESVAAAAVKAYDKMPALCVPGAQNKLIAGFSKLAPRSFIAGQAEKIYRKARQDSKSD
jgi:short-subunit dehydrogenase